MIKNSLIEFLKNNFINIEKLSENEWIELIKLSKLQNVSNILFYNLKKNNFDSLIPKKQYESLKNAYQKIIFRNLKIKSEIIKINKNLKENNINVIFLKGSYLINHIYENISLRYMQDIDLLVKKDNSQKSFELIKELLYISERDLDEHDYNFSFLHHLPKMRKENILLEIHSNIINSKFDIGNIWKNSIQINDISYLDEIDLIIHLSIHISYQDIFCIDLRHYYDIFYILKNKNIDLNKVFSRSNEYGFEKGVFIVLKIIETLFYTNLEIPISIDSINNQDIYKAINLMWLYDKTNLTEYIEYKKNPNIYKEFKKSNFINQIILFVRKVFITKDVLKHKYKITNNKLLYFYYLIRIKDLIKNHFKSINNKYYKDKSDLLVKIN